MDNIDDAALAQTFEFDFGLALELPNVAGAAIGEGEWFRVDDGVGGDVEFEFTKGAAVAPGRVAIDIDNTMSTEEVIQVMIARINANVDVVGVAPNPANDPNRLFLTRAMDLDVTGAPHLAILGHAPVPGALASGNTRVPISGDMTRADVGRILTQVVNQQLIRDRDTNAGVLSGGSSEVLRMPTTMPGDFDFFTVEALTHRGEMQTATFVFRTGFAGVNVPDPVNDPYVYEIGILGVATDVQLAQAVADAINATNNSGVASGTQAELMISANASAISTGGGQIATVEFDLADTPVTIFSDGDSGLSLWNANNAIINWDSEVGDLHNLIGYSMTDSGPLGYSGSGGWNGNAFGELEGDHTWQKGEYSGDYRMNNRFNLFERGQDNNYEGFYIDDIIVGFAERGELVTDAYRDGTDTGFDFAPEPQPTLFPEYPIVMEGSYQLEVRTGANYAESSEGGDSYPVTYVIETMDTNDRMADNFTLIVPAANEIHHGQWFELSDGRDDMTQRFVFVDETVGGGAGYGEIRIDFNAGDTADDMAQKVAAAINQGMIDGEIDISAKAITQSGRVDLFGAVRLNNDPLATNPVNAEGYPTTGGDSTFDKGDSNRERQKGQITIAGNSVTHSLDTGILVAPTRDSAADWAFPASGLTMNDPNNLVGGIMIENNLVAYNGQVGIGFQGNSNPDGSPVGAIPFGRIVNNTVYGGSGIGIGIDIGPNASPTLLNNIVANLNTGIRVDTTSAAEGTVIGGSLYKDNAIDLDGNVQESFAEVLGTNDPLFVDAAGGNFYLDHGSLAIDSSIDSLEERQGYFNRVLQPVGIPVSPILAPETDMFGQLRRDDPSAASPVGLGNNVFKDRGAIDRVDFVAPTSSIADPLDNGVLDELDTVAHDVKVVGEKILKFTIQLMDEGGVGIDDSSVVKPAIHLYRDLDETTYGDPVTRDAELVEGDDYKMVYNATNDTIDLIPLSGLWAEGYDYTIVLDSTIRDEANNSLQPNRYSGTFDGLTVFKISLAGLDFGDAPDDPGILTSDPLNPGVFDYPSLLASDGPRHVIYSGFHLGSGVNSETDARTTTNADGDLFDDGVTIPGSGLLAGQPSVDITLNVSLQNQNLIDLYGNSAYVHAWFDWDGDKLFNSTNESFSTSVVDGLNTLTIAVDPGASGSVMARFRLSTDDAAIGEPTGEARDGEVEDYVFVVVEHLKDYGDAPSSYLVTEADNGAWHSTNSQTDPAAPDFYLGSVAPDSELDGVPSLAADSDDLDGTDDEDGVDVANRVMLADGTTGNTITVTVSGEAGETGYLNAWFDLNADGDWDDTVSGIDEHFIVGTDANAEFTFGSSSTTIERDFTVTIPALPGGLDEQAISYARFRFSSSQTYEDGYAGGYAPGGVDAVDGEVEDYQVFIVNEARDYGDAPDGVAGLADYPTLISSNGASHAVVAGLSLGSGIDAEYDGQPNSTATGDDIVFPTNGGNDEDGILFDAFSRLVPGGVAIVDVKVTNTSGDQAYLYGWIDFNGDGDWDDQGEQIFAGEEVDPGLNTKLEINVPELFDVTDPDAISVLGDTYARFRLSTDTNLAGDAPADLSYDGYVSNGEVEDYLVTIEIGDATIQGKKFNDLDADGVYDSSVQGTIPGIQLEKIGNGPTILNETDNDWTSAHPLGFTLEYYGNKYTSLYVSPNGVVSFQDPAFGNIGTTPGFPAVGAAIAPFWADADLTASGGTVHMSTGVSERGEPFVQIDWNNVAFYDNTSATNPDLRNTFSLYLENAPAGDIVAFAYDTMQWTTGDLAGTDGFGGAGAEIGFNAGNGTQYYSEMRPNSQQGLDDLNTAIHEIGVVPDNSDSPVYGFGYRLDPTTGLLAKGEPGLAGVEVYLDYDNDGAHDSNEPITVTRQDDLGTPNIDETGEFEFTGLFSGSYTVREVLEKGWVQTYPQAELTYLPDVTGNKILAIAGSDVIDSETFLVSDGTNTVQFEFEDTDVNDGTAGLTVAVDFNQNMSASDVANAIATAINGQALEMTASVSGDVVILVADTVANPLAVVSIDPESTMLVVLGNSRVNADRSYTIEVDAGETSNEVLFGNHKLTTISVANVSVAEGPLGEDTVVEVVFERRGSFGATVKVDYHTIDGTAEENDSVYIGDSDYIGADTWFEFGPQDEPQATWDQQSITHNQTNDYDYHVSGDTIVYEVADGNDWEILVYNNTVGGDPIALTDNVTEDRFADVYRIVTDEVTKDGIIYAVWAGVDPVVGQNDYEIFFSEIEVTGGGLNVLRTVQVTDNDTHDRSPRVSDSHVTWWGYDEVAGDQEIYLSDIASIVAGSPVIHNISSSDYSDSDPVIDGNRVVWRSVVGDDTETEIFLYDGTFLSDGVTPASARRITNNQATNAAPQIDGNYIVWQGLDGVTTDIFLYEIDTWTTTQLTFDGYNDVDPQISGDNIVWEGGSSSNREILLYNVVDGGAPANISDNPDLDERPQIHDNRIVWHTFNRDDSDPNNHNWEVTFFDLNKPFLPLNVSDNLNYDWGPQISGDCSSGEAMTGKDYEIVVASQNDPVATQTVLLTIIGDYNLEDDEVFHVVIDDATVDGITLPVGETMYDGQAGDIWIYNDDGEIDYGDAPASYHTLIGDNGARHVTHATDSSLAEYYLGAGVDAEDDGRPSADAKGDDGWFSDDEDGVSIRSHWLPGGEVQLVVTASLPGYLTGWVDYDADGNFGDEFGVVDREEQLRFTDENLVSDESILLQAGENRLTITVPDTVTLGDTIARFRFSTLDDLNYLGSAPDGEVEDYAITITTDKPGVVITATDSSNDVIEGGTGDTYSVVLTARPNNTVWVNIAGDEDVTTAQTRLRFTRDNWDLAQTVTIAAIDDAITEFIEDPTDPTKSLPHVGLLTHDGREPRSRAITRCSLPTTVSPRRRWRST